MGEEAETLNNEDKLLAELDDLARDFDPYDYGLPLHDDEAKEKMRQIIRTWRQWSL